MDRSIDKWPAPDGALDETDFVREPAASILNLAEGSGPDIFVAGSGSTNHLGTVFGGRLLAQSLCAAVRTIEDMPLTSLHAYFIAPGHTGRPLEYRVTRLRDSRRFANRQVTAHQEGRLVFMLLCQFHAPEDSFAHQAAPMPAVPPPESLVPVQHYVRYHQAELNAAAVHNFAGALPVELRPVAPDTYFKSRPQEPMRDFWFRLPSADALADPRLHQCLLAFASDYWLAGVSAVPHEFPTNSRALLISSLDHALWFHGPARSDQWLLHHTKSPSAGEGVGFATGQIFDRTGRLVASTAQECLLRRLEN
ncbi:acyl-CoA thioesterase II [Novosphingobium endophyticum]|uniref:Acyl-CoA thioesterase II n=1 Tax=Novosphingobium endophyticum TaxID=1955250 RepID=A0A916X4W7_9SPHN|nr:acyl-CoA thioesterase domain-containing protein [Novosphingobium endophyticum]GGC03480.1 acyl-CoA thioesterase II [Novosphingobium endophyticum]